MAKAQTVSDKLASLRYCLENEHYEDALGHLMDLVVFVKTKLDPNFGSFNLSINLLERYGYNPVKE